MIRIAATAIAAVLLAAAVIRNAVVDAWADSRPAVAGKAWPGHPAVEQVLLMTAVGGKARAGGGTSPEIAARAARLIESRPLAVEPFLIAGVSASVDGRTALAERLFEAAHRRDVRSLPAHYFLAEAYLRSDRVADGLREIAHLGRLSPGGIGALPPYLAQYARLEANWPAMRQVMRENFELAGGILAALAPDARNSRAILALVDGRHRGPQAAWLPIHLKALIDAGDYAAARRMWGDVARPAGGKGLIYDPGFSDPVAPPPFNWSLTSSAIGVADRRPGGTLDVLFYGLQGGTLAQQLLVLKPGAYTLSMQVGGNLPDPQALSWTVTCEKGAKRIGTFPVRKTGAYRWTFAVPAGCPAQWLRLEARAQDMTVRTQATIRNLALTAGGAGA